YSQSTSLSGYVRDPISKEGISAVSVLIKGSSEGSFTDSKGFFKLNTNLKLPITLLFSSVGFETKELEVTNTEEINIELNPSATLGEEVVVAATRTATRAMESPVSIERLSAANINTSPATSYYDMVGQLKGVDI